MGSAYNTRTTSGSFADAAGTVLLRHLFDCKAKRVYPASRSDIQQHSNSRRNLKGSTGHSPPGAKLTRPDGETAAGPQIHDAQFPR